MESNQNTSVKNTGNKQENNATGKWNPGQQRAICYGDGPLLVLAGPGSGKTTVIAHRVQRKRCGSGLRSFAEKACRR